MEMTEDAAQPVRDPGDATDAGRRHARLRKLFAAAVEVEDSARPAWIAAHVPDAGERAALERLLAADRSGAGFLDTPVDEHVARMAVRRYSSARAWADDAQHDPARPPAEAHPRSRRHRARKFAQRHRAGVAFAAVLVLTIVAALALALS